MYLWEAIIVLLERQTKLVYSVLFFQDSKHILCFIFTSTLFLIHLTTQSMFGTQGPEILMASGTVSRLIHIWDAVTRDIMMGPLTRHANPVKSVVFLKDAKHIVFASVDKTIWLWDVAISDSLQEKATQMLSTLLYSHMMENVLLLAQLTEQSVSGMQRLEILFWAH
jgi:WD40 repeat protein